MGRLVVALCLVALCSPLALAQGLVLSSTPPPPQPGSARATTPIWMGEHRVEAKIEERIAHVTVQQVFSNRTDRALEGTYLFPLPPNASVSNFAMTMGGKMVEGEVLEAGKARSIYESIVRRRRDPGLLEYVGQGLFRARVFPIPPRGEVKVRIRYQQLLDEQDGTIRFRYPLATDRMQRSPVGSALIDVTYASGAELRSVYSPSHRVDVAREGERAARVTFESSRQRQLRDFSLYFHRSADEVGCSVLSTKAAAADGSFLAVLAPKRNPDTIVAKDVLYIVDRSGSMEGGKIAQAKDALRYGISLLRDGDRFNVLSFATDSTPFRPSMVPVTPSNRAAASQWIGEQMATGGTALADALVTGLKMGESGRLFLVVLITDGKPTVGLVEREKILEAAREAARNRPRVFTFGVGYDLDVKLLDRIAEGTGGARDYIAPKEKIDDVTAGFFRKIGQPVLTDVTLEFGPGIKQVYPRKLGDLFAGDQIVVMGRYEKSGATTIALRGRRGATEIVHEYDATLVEGGGPAHLARLWAQRKVAFLLDEIRLHGANKELVDEVTALARRFSIVTPYTAGLVLEDGPISSSSPIFFDSKKGRRGPWGGVPPGLREPSDPQPQPPPPPATPGAAAGPTTPGGPSAPPVPAPVSGPKKRNVSASKQLKEAKETATAETEARVQDAGGKTFRIDRNGRWVDTAWDEKTEAEKIEAYSDAYFDLIAKDTRIAKFLAVGERVLFVFGEKVYEISPAGGA